MKNHGERIGFLAGGATCDPDANLFAFGDMLQEVRNSVVLEICERFGVSEELSDSDQEVVVQQTEFFIIRPQTLYVGRQVIGAQKFDPSEYPPADCSGFV